MDIALGTRFNSPEKTTMPFGTAKVIERGEVYFRIYLGFI